MSRKSTPHFADAKGVFQESPAGMGYGLLAEGTAVPTDATAGYQEGCLFFVRSAGAGVTGLYKNEGTQASCAFKRVLSLTDVGGTTLAALTATAAELNTLHTQTLTTGPGAGFTDGVGAVAKTSVWANGGIYTTRFLLDLTGTASSTTDLDIIGSGTSAAYIGQVTAAQNGTVLGGTMTCLEVPTGGIADIDLYWATEATGKFDDAVAGLTETALITSGGNWTLALTKAIADPVGMANGYLYLTGGAAGTASAYTAGKFLITLFGY
jgi:hypothetical protein